MQEVLILKVKVLEDTRIDDVILAIEHLDIVDDVELVELYKEE